MKLFREIDDIKSHFEQPIHVDTYELDNSSIEYQYDTRKEIAFITFMSASKYLSGDTDELGKKPFFNIVNQIVDLEIRATDIDTKDIILRPTSPEFEVQAMLATKYMHNMFKEMNFAETLNEYGEMLARYGNVLFKRSYDENGKLDISIVNWLSIAFDQFDIENGAKVESHYMTSLELESKRGIWIDEAIDEALEALDQQREDKDKGNTNVIEVLEVEGQFSKAVYMENELESDEEAPKGYSLQHYFVIGGGEENKGVLLFKEELKESNYIYDGRKKRLGVGWALGVVEEGKEAQGEVNLYKILERRALELASIGLMVTDDEELDDLNVLTEKKRGDTLLVRSGKTYKNLDTTSNSLQFLPSAVNSWQDSYKSTMSAFDSVTGEETTSGLSYRLGLLQAKQASSIFDYRREKKGICLGSKVITKWILPEVAKGIDKDFILEAGFSAEEIDIIHDRFALSIANRKVQDILESGRELDPLTYQEMIAEVKDNLPKKEIQFLDIKKGDLKEAIDNIRVDITGEEENVAAKLETLNSLLQMAMQDQTGAFPPETVPNLVKEITRLAGVSMVEYGLGTPSAKKPVESQLGASQGQGDIPTINSVEQNAQGNNQIL